MLLHHLSLLFQWADDTDMAKLEECVRSVQADGLLWGTSKLVPVGYGIKKLQIACVVEDDKVGTDLLEDEITKFEDYVSTVQYTEQQISQWVLQYQLRTKTSGITVNYTEEVQIQLLFYFVRMFEN